MSNDKMKEPTVYQPEFFERIETTRDTGKTSEEHARLVMEKMRSFIKKGITVNDDEAEEIIQDTLAAAIKAQQRFTGENGAKFKTYVYGIMKHKKRDFINKKNHHIRHAVPLHDNGEKERTDDEVLSALYLKTREKNSSAQMAEEITKILKEHLLSDPTGCARLFLDIWHTFKQGYKIKDLAAKYGVKPNTLIKRRQRCQEPVLQMLEE